MTEKRKPNIFSTPYLTRMAILTAISFLLFLIQIPVVAFYKLDLSNLPVLLGAFSMGTVPGLIILALKCMLALLRTTSGGVGDLADFIMSAALIIPASVLYHRHKTRKNALIGMAIGTLCMVVVGVLANKYIMLPFYMGAYHMNMDGILKYANVGGVVRLYNKHLGD